MTPVTGEAGLTEELRREQQQVDRAYARLEELRAVAVARERDSLGGPRGGTPQALYERDVVTLAATARRSILDGAGDGLVFGRLDRVDKEVLHVGRLGLRTEEQEPIVVDWRAPAAAAFYRATAADPQGVIRRRTLTSRGQRVIGLEDELLDPAAEGELDGTVVVGDGAFLAAVSRERGSHMRDIVATIQREQDEAVRAPDDGALLVTGGPGTGKTAVALHRVAYLMYAKREYYSRRGVLVVGPSPVFVDYISAVLPALGETSVRLASLGSVPELPPGLAATGYDSPAAAAVKGSLRMAELLKRAVRALSSPGRPAALEVTHWGTAISINGSELGHLRSRVARSHRSHNAGRLAFRNQVLEAGWRAWQRRPTAGQVEDEDRDDFLEWLKDEPALTRTLDALWPVLEPLPVLTQLLRGDLPMARLADGLLSPEEQRVLSAAGPAGGEVTAADAALLDELGALLGPPPEPEPDVEQIELAELEALAKASEVTTFADRNRASARDIAREADYRTFAHVVVDEAQDVTPMQWRMLARRARGATWTVVGDWAQSAWPDPAEVRTALRECLGRARLREAELTTNYRTGTEIAALAAELLARIDPTATPPAAVRSTGHEPRRYDDIGDLEVAVEAVLADVTGTVGVVCPHALLTPLTEQLAELRAAHPRLSVVDTWQVKGLEYDGCVVVSPEGVVAEALNPLAGLRSLYVAVTRATQRLAVVGRLPEPPGVAPH